MEIDTQTKQLFQAIDKMDTEAFLSFLAEDVLFRFGNAEPVKGKQAVGDVIRGFFSSIGGLRHVVLETWKQADTIICRGEVTYTRKDSSTLTVPFADFLRKKSGDGFKEYLIYADVSQLYKKC